MCRCCVFVLVEVVWCYGCLCLFCVDSSCCDVIHVGVRCCFAFLRCDLVVAFELWCVLLMRCVSCVACDELCCMCCVYVRLLCLGGALLGVCIVL